MKKTFTRILFVLVALIPFVANAGSGIFIRGGVTNWGALPEWEFVDKGNGVYTLENKVLMGAFKVADAGWTDAVNYGSNGTDIVLDKDYVMTSKGGNINVSGTITCEEIKLTIINGVATLHLKGVTKPEDEIDKVYVIGDNTIPTAWNFNDATGVLLPIDETNQIFMGNIVFPEGAELSFWRIYEHLGQVGSWGLEENSAVHTPEGVLMRGKEGCVTLTPNTYEIVFDISNGNFSATPLGGVGEIESDSNSVKTLDGSIVVSGDVTSVDVYSVSGSLISTGRKSVEVQSGIYIVVVDNKATKVAVK